MFFRGQLPFRTKLVNLKDRLGYKNLVLFVLNLRNLEVRLHLMEPARTLTPCKSPNISFHRLRIPGTQTPHFKHWLYHLDKIMCRFNAFLDPLN